jgi:hypothetical protein
MVGNSPINRPGELRDGIDGSYRLRIVDFEAFFIDGLVSVHLLAVFSRRVIDGVAIFIL